MTEEHTPAQETTTTATQTTEPAHTGEVVGNSASGGELSQGATIGISTGIGVCNVCCGPTCYCMPAFATSIVGFVLYFMWKEEKPNTAKTILTVTLVTAGIALAVFLTFFLLGFASAILEEVANY